jgi:tetratricopeptide (TPR) repeat protein
MPDSQRIDDLRRRVQRDPASIAFAQLAEELRRAGEHQESVDTCRAGLAIHPSYLSARVTLGRALLELDQLDDAATELGIVLKSAPDNLAALRAMAEIHQRRGNLVEALAQYRRALTIARNDPDLEETVADLARTVEPRRPPGSPDDLSHAEFLQHLPAPPAAAAAAALDATPAAAEPETPPALEADSAHEARLDSPLDAERALASRTIVALEHWLSAIHDARADRRA